VQPVGRLGGGDSRCKELCKRIVASAGELVVDDDARGAFPLYEILALPALSLALSPCHLVNGSPVVPAATTTTHGPPHPLQPTL